MKALVVVENVNQVPAKLRQGLVVISPQTWQDDILFLQDKKTDQYVYISQNTPLDRLLKLFEEMDCNLCVYVPATMEITPVLMSRFSVLRNRCPVKDVQLIPEDENERRLSRIRTAL